MSQEKEIYVHVQISLAFSHYDLAMVEERKEKHDSIKEKKSL